eukprot:9852084-Heterocapsa_arctica.AAC.1
MPSIALPLGIAKTMTFLPPGGSLGNLLREGSCQCLRKDSIYFVRVFCPSIQQSILLSSHPYCSPAKHFGVLTAYLPQC